MKDEAIKEVLTGMVGMIDKENIELYEKLIDLRNGREIKDIESFYFELIHPYRKFLKGLIKKEISNNSDIEFLLLNSTYVESHFATWIKQKEGWACSADKSRTIMSRLFSWFTSGAEIKWDYSQEYTFGFPKKVFTTHDDVIKFYESIKSLYYGNPQKYLDAIKTIVVIPSVE